MFDETLVRNQDDELNLRLTRAGGKIWQSPDIVSWYSPRATLTALFLQYFQYGFWKAAVVRKHRLPGSWRHLVPVAFVLANVYLLLRGVRRDGGGANPGQFALAGRLAGVGSATYFMGLTNDGIRRSRPPDNPGGRRCLICRQCSLYITFRGDWVFWQACAGSYRACWGVGVTIRYLHGFRGNHSYTYAQVGRHYSSCGCISGFVSTASGHHAGGLHLVAR